MLPLPIIFSNNEKNNEIIRLVKNSYVDKPNYNK